MSNNNNNIEADDPEAPPVGENETDESSPGTNSEASLLAEESEKPWPATFERSISLLASPIISTPQAEHFTRSPKPGGTPLSGRRAQVSLWIEKRKKVIPQNTDHTRLLIINNYLHLIERIYDTRKVEFVGSGPKRIAGFSAGSSKGSKFGFQVEISGGRRG